MISTFSSLASVMGIWWVCDGRLTEFKFFIAFLACQEREEEAIAHALHVALYCTGHETSREAL